MLWRCRTQLIEKGYVERGFLGISPVNLSPAIAAQIGVPVAEGILVARVVENSGAAAAGLQGEDVIVAMGGQEIRNTGELSKFLLDNLPRREGLRPHIPRQRRTGNRGNPRRKTCSVARASHNPSVNRRIWTVANAPPKIVYAWNRYPNWRGVRTADQD